MGACRADHAGKPLCIFVKAAEAQERRILKRERGDFGQDFFRLVIYDLFGRKSAAVDFKCRQRIGQCSARRNGTQIFKIRLPQHILGLYRTNGIGQEQRSSRRCCSAVCADRYDIAASLQQIRTVRRVIGCHIRQGKHSRHGFLLTGQQLLRFGKGAKLLPRLIQLAHRLAQIHLYDLLAGVSANIFYGSGHGNRFTADRHRSILHPEIGIGKPISEREQRFFVKGIKIAVAHIDALAVAGRVSVLKIGHWRVAFLRGPCGRQLAGGIAFAQKNVCQRCACLHAQLGKQQNVAHFHNRGQIDHAAGVQHQHKMFICPIQSQNIPHFGIGQQNIALAPCAVAALAGDAADNVNCGLSAAIQRQVVFGFWHGFAHAVQKIVLVGGFGGGFQFLFKLFVRRCPVLLVSVQPCGRGDGKARVPQPGFNRHAVTGVYLARAGAALDGAAHTAAICGNFAGLF